VQSDRFHVNERALPILICTFLVLFVSPVFAIATTFILVGSTKILIVIATYTDFLIGLVSKLRSCVCVCVLDWRLLILYRSRARSILCELHAKDPDDVKLPRAMCMHDHL
jgi:hypothetical protein